MLSAPDLRECAIKPVVASLDGDTPEAVDLMLGTALAESGLIALKQAGGGPAIGLWQMEPATHDDIWLEFLPSRAELSGAVSQYVCGAGPSTATQMAWHLRYACAMARCEYLRVPEPVPTRIEDQADYWCRFYNRGGAATPEHYLAAWDTAGFVR